MIKNMNKRFGKAGLALFLAMALLVGGAVTALAAPAGGLFQGDTSALVERVLAINGSLDADALAQLTSEELRDLIRTGAPDMPIGQQAAYDAALAWAGLDESDVTVIDVDPELDEYTPYYDVELNVDGREYDYTVAAYTGEVLYGEQPAANKAALVTGITGPVFDAAGDIGEDAAVAAALAWDGLPVDIGDAAPRVRADYDDGRYHYDVTFEAGGYGYEYEVDPATGELLSLQIEKLYTAPAGSGGDIGRDAAITAALDHAGVAAGDVTWSECKQDTDDGRLEYEVDFRAGGMEYEYTIDAASGAVLDFDKETAD